MPVPHTKRTITHYGRCTGATSAKQQLVPEVMQGNYHTVAEEIWEMHSSYRTAAKEFWEMHSNYRTAAEGIWEMHSSYRTTAGGIRKMQGLGLGRNLSLLLMCPYSSSLLIRP